MAFSASAVGEGAAGRRDELPVVSSGSKDQLQDAIRGIRPDLTCGQDGAKTIEILAACADYKLTHSLRTGLPIGVHGHEALVVVLVAVKHHFGTGLIQDLPQGLVDCVAAMVVSR